MLGLYPKAQEHAADQEALDGKLFSIHHDDSIETLKEFFTRGHAHGHIRNSLMATIQEGRLMDYWSNATGGALKYETAEWYGLTLGVKGIFTYNTLGGDLNEVDPLTGRAAKWEIELYDLLRPTVTNDLDRLVELYATYRLGKSYVSYGRLNIDQGPLLKMRDGRMKPFVYRGIWSEIDEFQGHKVRLGYITGVSPRGTVEWFDLNEAIGLNGNGKQPDGSSAHYHETSGIRGLGVIGYENKKLDGFTFNLWNFYFDRQSDITWVQGDFKKGQFIAGVQYVHERSLAAQADLEYEERYMQTGETANVMNLLVGLKDNKKGIELSASYLKAFDTGRFLFPRELGREDFYSSQPRAWIDGFGDVTVYMLRFRYKKENKEQGVLELDARFSRTDAPDIDDARFNKYGIPSFYQVTLLPHYTFGKVLEGLDLGFLYVYKVSEDGFDLSPSERYYKTNLHHMNLVMNINF